MTDGRFMRAFLNKGRMKPYVAAIPVRVVTSRRWDRPGDAGGDPTEVTG